MLSKTLSEKTDEELVKLSLENKENYLYLMRRYEPKLLRYIFRLTNSPKEDAEDILQEVFLKVYLNLNDFNPKLKFSSWIYRICHNEVISFWRKTKSTPKNVELFDNDPKASDDTPVYHELDQKLNKAKIDEILAKMSLKYRDIIVLRYFENKDYSEIADILKTPIGTVGTLLLRAKKAFKIEVDKAKINF
jgi:RNA polymerase sigma-70 factor (ECF subfamily)